MPGAARLNDIGSGHACFPATPVVEGSQDVIINGQPAARQGDAVQLHGCPCPNMPHGLHPRQVAAGSSNVIINGKQAARIGDDINCGGNIVTGSSDVIIGNTPYQSSVAGCAKQAASKHSPLLAFTPMLAMEPVFAKSCMRGAGCTDAGTTEEPQSNIGDMSIYVTVPRNQPNSPYNQQMDVTQHAQAAKKKLASKTIEQNSSASSPSTRLPSFNETVPSKSTVPSQEPWYQTLFNLMVGKADAAMLPAPSMIVPPPPIVIEGTAMEAGATATAGGAIAQANQDMAKALTRKMHQLSGRSLWQLQLGNEPSLMLLGLILQQKLKGEKADLLTPEKLLMVAKQRGTVPSRVRYQWTENEETGRLKAVGYHTSMESGRDQVRVRLLMYDFPNNRYEFWEEGATGTTILWTPDNPGVELPSDTAHGEQPVISSAVPGFEIPEMDDVTILATPMPDEKDFRDYILVFPENEFPPIYVYLGKPPVEFLEVELYSNFAGRSRQGEYQVDHIPSAAAVKAHYKRLHPELGPKELNKLSKRVAAISVPTGVHQKNSETYGGRNTPQKIEEDSNDLHSAVDSNFDAEKQALKEYGATEEQLEKARAKLHQLNESVGLYKK